MDVPVLFGTSPSCEWVGCVHVWDLLQGLGHVAAGTSGMSAKAFFCLAEEEKGVASDSDTYR